MVDNQKIIAVIPARGGSKRIPHKNIIDLCGKPLIAWTIEAAQRSKIFDRIIVSTDDQEIARVSEIYGADIPFIREEYSDDFSPISVVTANALENLLPEKYDIVVQLMANCPLRNESDFIAALKNFNDKQLDFQISCFKFGWMNPWWAYKLNENMEPEPLFEKEIRVKRSQDQPELYCPTGATWIAKAEKLIETKDFYSEGFGMYPMSWQNAIDIDNYDDLEMAEYFLKKRND